MVMLPLVRRGRFRLALLWSAPLTDLSFYICVCRVPPVSIPKMILFETPTNAGSVYTPNFRMELDVRQRSTERRLKASGRDRSKSAKFDVRNLLSSKTMRRQENNLARVLIIADRVAWTMHFRRVYVDSCMTRRNVVDGNSPKAIR
jgi:hypothetical protein